MAFTGWAYEEVAASTSICRIRNPALGLPSSPHEAPLPAIGVPPGGSGDRIGHAAAFLWAACANQQSWMVDLPVIRSLHKGLGQVRRHVGAGRGGGMTIERHGHSALQKTIGLGSCRGAQTQASETKVHPPYPACSRPNWKRSFERGRSDCTCAIRCLNLPSLSDPAPGVAWRWTGVGSSRAGRFRSVSHPLRHAPLFLRLIESDAFDYINLHGIYPPAERPAIDAPVSTTWPLRDQPTDKGAPA